MSTLGLIATLGIQFYGDVVKKTPCGNKIVAIVICCTSRHDVMQRDGQRSRQIYLHIPN